MKRLNVLIVLILIAGFSVTSCKKKDPCEKEKTPYELLTMDDWHLYKEKISSSSGSSFVDLDMRFVFTTADRYYYFNGNDSDYTESGIFELDEESDPMILRMDKDYGPELIYNVIKLAETEMELEYESSNVTYTFYFERN